MSIRIDAVAGRHLLRHPDGTGGKRLKRAANLSFQKWPRHPLAYTVPDFCHAVVPNYRGNDNEMLMNKVIKPF